MFITAKCMLVLTVLKKPFMSESLWGAQTLQTRDPINGTTNLNLNF